MMKNKLFVLLALALVFISVTMLAATIQYSSGLIGVKVQPQDAYGSDINITGQASRTDNGEVTSNNNDTSQGGNSLNLDLSKLPSISDALSSIGGAKDPDKDKPFNWLLVIALLIILLLLALIGFLLWRRYMKKQKTLPVEMIEVVPEAPLEYFEGDLKISFPGINAPLPAIWGISEKLEMVVQDKTGKSSGISLYIGGEPDREIALENGAAHVWLELPKGDHRVTVIPKGSSKSSWVDVRIVDYREEIVKIFNDMYRSYRISHGSAGDDMTARELELAMRQEMPEDQRQRLGDTVTLFEYANYSRHDILRKDFETMYISRISLAQAAEGANV